MDSKIKSCFHAIWRFVWGRITTITRWRYLYSSRRITFQSFVLLLTLVCCIFVLFIYVTSSYFVVNEAEIVDVIDLSQNYLAQDFRNEDFLVNTAKCKIPDFDIWDDSIFPLIKTPNIVNCAEKTIHLTYVEKNGIIINEDALTSIGYTIDDITCCYRTIERIEQTYESFDMNADNLFRFSEECVPMGKTTKPKSSFIKVMCEAKGFFSSRFKKYTNFHMLAMFPDEANNISKKISWWKNCLSTSEDESCIRFQQKGRPPPNVMVLGWDSTSRGNFHRFMPKATEVLKNIVQAVEMVGYNKVGENTLPNFGPLMTSLSYEELEKECFQNNSVPFDSCPFIWKRFSAHNYLTAHLEDDPELAIFNFLKTGFIKPPVDIYPRSFMLAAYEQNPERCIGYQRPEEILLNYVVNFAELAESTGLPYVMTTWLTDLSHGNINNLKLADVEMRRTLIRLKENGLLENTILIVMGDHGYRFGSLRLTNVGWLEDKLPTLWIKLPPSIVNEQPSWLKALEYNSRMLTTPFDMHKIFQQILTSFWPKKKPNKVSNVKSVNLGISPFQKIPERSCDEAGIPDSFCSCIPPVACTNSSFITLAASMVTKDINKKIPPECTPLKVGTVIACGTMNKTFVGSNEGSLLKELKDSVKSSRTDEMIVAVTFYTLPGKFLFEGIVNYNTTTKQFVNVSTASRMNGKNHDSSCLVIRDSRIELMCFCEPRSLLKTVIG